MRQEWEYKVAWIYCTVEDKEKGVQPWEKLRTKLTDYGKASWEVISIDRTRDPAKQENDDFFVTMKKLRIAGKCGECDKELYTTDYLCEECRKN